MVVLKSEKLQEGWEAPDFELPGADGSTYSLDDFTDKKGVLVVFTCNHCPYAKAAWPVLTEMCPDYADEIAFAAINPNDAGAYPEDSFEVMKQKLEEWDIPFPYLRDKSQEVARAYQAQCTPDPYLFRVEEGTAKLFYHGRINDNWKNPDEAKERNLRDALDRLIAGDPPPEKQPASMGCSIKWKK